MYRKLWITSVVSLVQHSCKAFRTGNLTTGKLLLGDKSDSESSSQPCRPCSNAELSMLVSKRRAALSRRAQLRSTRLQRPSHNSKRVRAWRSVIEEFELSHHAEFVSGH